MTPPGPQQFRPRHSRPAVPLAVALTAGILCHSFVVVSQGRLLISIAVGVTLAAIFLRVRLLGSLSLLATLFLVGVGFARREHYQFASDDIAQFVTDEPRLAEVELHLVDEPRLSAGPLSDPRPLPPKQNFLADVTAVRTWAGWVPATGRLPVNVNSPDPSLAAGQTIRALGALERPRPAANPGEFDWAAYYRDQRILATLTVNRIGNIHVVADPGPGPLTWLRLKARHLFAAGFTDDHATEYGLLRALVLGDRDPQLRDVQEEFQSVGVGYQLNVSGLHIAVLAGLVALACRVAGLRPRPRFVVTAGFVLLYGAVSLPSHSGFRSVMLTIALGIAFLCNRSAVRGQAIALVVVAMLLVHPMDVFSAGFQLSFAVVIAFAVVIPRFRQWSLDRRDIAAPPVPPTIAGRFFALVGRAAVYSVVAWVVTLPLVAYDFGLLTPWSPVVGLVLMPVIFLALTGGVLKIVFTLLWPSMAGVWATAAGRPMTAIQSLVHQSTRLPGSPVVAGTPPVWLIVGYYGLLVVPFVRVPKAFRKARWLSPVAGVLLICLLPRSPVAVTSTGLKLTLISLGAGQCAIVETPDGHADVFDAGSSTVPDVARKIIGPFLAAENVRRVDDIFLSHGDYDHISAAADLAAGYGARDVLTSFHFRKNSAGNEPDSELLDTLDRLDLPPHQIATGDRIDLGGGAVVTVLWPPQTGDLNSNNAGLVLQLTYAGRSILMPADIQDPAFAGLLLSPAALKSDVLIAPHHGSSESLTPAFLAAVHPGTIVSSNAARLTNKQKRFDGMVGSTPLLRTSKVGAITVTISPDGKITVGTFIHE